MLVFDEIKSLFEEEKIKENDIKKTLSQREYVQLLHQIKKRLKQGEDLTSAIKSELSRLYTVPKVHDNLIKPLSQITSLKSTIFEGGNMFSDVGKIHKSELEPTLNYISQKFGTNIKDNLLGSAGKNEYSGDIDIGLEMGDVGIDKYYRVIKSMFGPDVRRQGNLISVKIPIQNFDETKLKEKPRTGFVQVDFFPGNIDWLKFFHHAPSKEQSNYKGVHRNLAISAITPYVGRQESNETDSEGRPIELIRYKWSPDVGLVKISRTSIKNNKGGWLKKQEDKNISQPTKDPNQIANILFHGKFGADSLESLETIIQAINQSYDKNTKEDIFRNIAQTFKDNIKDYQNWNYPPEVQKYL